MPADPDPSTTPRHLDSAQAMRALAHPVRISLLELLTFQGPMTATQAAGHVGESPSNCSFHLRQLAKYGLVEEADDVAATGRARPWRTTQVGITTGPVGKDREMDAAAEVLTDVVIQRATQRHRQWQRRSENDWADIAGVSQTIWWVTQEEAQELSDELEALVGRYRERLAQRRERPADARPVEFLALVHPIEEQ